MSESEKITLTCEKCNTTFKCKSPVSPGRYSVTCVNPECREKVSFNFQVKKPQQSENSHINTPKIKLGLLDNGAYRFLCETCRQTVLAPADSVKPGHNKLYCPKCRTSHEFDIEPKESDLLKCQTADCEMTLEKPSGDDGIYSCICSKCRQDYSILVQNGKVIKVTMKTPGPIKLKSKKQWPMKLVVSGFLGKKEYILSKGCHYIGRFDNESHSDFEVKDKYASSRSIRIDVNDHAGNLVYKMTIERAMNPVFHNNQALSVGDIVYLTYGDTIKIGKTLIKIQKSQI